LSSKEGDKTMKETTTRKFEFSLVEVRTMVTDYLRKIGAVEGEAPCVEVKPIAKSVEVPGIDPHDCDYIEVFNGLSVVMSQDKEAL